MPVGEKRREAERQDAIAEMAKQEEIASKADEMLGGSYMMSKSTTLERENMGPQKLRARIHYIKGARLLGSMLVNALRSSDESGVHVEAEIREQLERAKVRGECANAMLFAIRSAKTELLENGRITLGPGSIADFEFGNYGTGLDALLSTAGRIAEERHKRIEKISRGRQIAENEKLGYMVTTAIISELESDARAFKKSVICGRIIYEKAKSVIEYLGNEPRLYADPFGRAPEQAMLDFLDRIDLVDAGSIVEELREGENYVSAVYMLIRQAAVDTKESNRSALSSAPA
jgi:hypothetical protein